MSKTSKNKYRNRQDLPEKPISKPASKNTGSAFDAFTNPLARTGFGNPSLLNATEYPLLRITRDYNLMNSLYRNSWIAKKIINTIPDDMCKNWYSITADLEPEELDRIAKLEQRTKFKEKLLEGLYWGRLYGGAAAIMMIKGHEDRLEEPLDIEDVMPNSFKGLMVVDRWSGIYPDVQLITDISDPDFGLPEYYQVREVTQQNAMVKVHNSRVIRFEGRKLPFWENQAEVYWGASELEHVFEELAKRDNTSWNIASLVFQANLLVNKIDGMDQTMAVTDPYFQEKLYNIKSAQNQMRNNNGMMIIGRGQEVSAMSYTFAGLNDIYESFMLDVAGASEIPVTRLFGRAPAGMNATGESDEQNYSDKIAREQSSGLKPKTNKVLPVMFMSELGYIPDDLDIQFKPFQTPSEEKVAEIISKKAAVITGAYISNLLTQKMAMKELHEMGTTVNMFTSITDEDINRANDDLDTSGMIGDIPEMSNSADVPEEKGEKEETKKQIKSKPGRNKIDGEEHSKSATETRGPKKMDPEEYTKRYGGKIEEQ